jgi:Family of unknown function (DUF5926)/SEC-C motif
MDRSPTAEVPAVSPRSPCPCGSGRRYKACHGARKRPARVMRPFAGRVDEPDLVALRELVPSATAPLVLTTAARAEHGERPVTLCSMLPRAAPALVRDNGELLVAMQTLSVPADPAAALARALVTGLRAEPGQVVNVVDDIDAPPLIELLDPGHLEITVHPGFAWWLPPAEDDAAPDPEVGAILERANATVVPTRRLSGVDAAYWCEIGDRRHLRWPLPFEEDRLLDALARLRAADDLSVGAGSHYVGSFRAHGLIVPVWDLAADADADSCEEPARELWAKLEKSVGDSSPLSPTERRARAGVVARTLTLR